MTTTKAKSSRPESPAAGGDALARLRRFHLGAPDAPAGGPPQSALPPTLDRFRGADSVRTDYPLFLGPPGAGEGALFLGFTELLERALRSLDGAGTPAGSTLRDNLKRLEAAVARRLPGSGPRDARTVLAEAGAAMADGMEIAPEVRVTLGDDLARLVAAVPAGGLLLPPGPGVPLALLGRALAARQHGPREAFAREARALAAQGEAILETERLKGAGGRDPERLGGAMGSLGGRYLDPAALAGMLGERRGSVARDAERVRRLEAAVGTLRSAAAEIAAPRPVLVHNGTLPWHIGPDPSELEEDGWTTLESADPCAVAAEVFERNARKTACLLRAARRVRLEVSGDYEPERHDLLLDGDGEGDAGGLDWQAFSRDELALLPPLVALESAGQLAERGMVSLARLLLSGRPVQVLVVDDPAADPGAQPEEAFTGFRFQPAYLGLAQREAFVQQGSLSRPLELAAGFLRAAGAARAALHVVDAPATDEPLPAAVLSGAALEGRAHPVFLYDPDLGTSWAERLDFTGNPAAEEDWPVHDQAPFTFADYALLAPGLAEHFLPVPDGVPDRALVSVPEWLALEAAEALEAVPYVRAVVPDPRGRGQGASRPVRLAVSRRLALACRDRLGYWRTLQELAGVKSEYVRRAEVRAREAAAERFAAERERLEAAHAAELDRVRRRTAEEVVNRLTASLLGVDLGGEAMPGASPLAAFAGGDVEEVSSALLGMVGPDATDGALATGDGQPPSEAVDRVVGELLAMAGPLDLRDEDTLDTTASPETVERQQS